MKNIILTEAAPAAIGPYSQAVAANGFVFVSGQLPLDPRTGALVGADAAEQTEQVLANLTAVLAAAGADLADVVKTTVFLKDMNDFSAMNGVYAKFFASSPPARAAVEVARLPKDAKVEIEAVAVIVKAPTGIEAKSTKGDSK